MSSTAKKKKDSINWFSFYFWNKKNKFKHLSSLTPITNAVEVELEIKLWAVSLILIVAHLHTYFPDPTPGIFYWENIFFIQQRKAPTK